MIAIVEIYGKQYKVSKGDTVVVDSKIDLETGKIVKFDNIKAVLDKNTNIFNPKELSSYKVSAKVVDHTRADKVLVIKKKRRKGYQRKNGHRQDLTMIQIQSISGTKKKVASATKKKVASVKRRSKEVDIWLIKKDKEVQEMEEILYQKDSVLKLLMAKQFYLEVSLLNKEAQNIILDVM